MARCRDCKKPIKWIQIPDGDHLKWAAFEKNFRPYIRHVCKKKTIEPRAGAEPPDEPWWMK